MNFAIRAIGPHGVETLYIDAASQEDAVREMAGRNLRLLSIKAAKQSAWQVSTLRLTSSAQPSFDLLLFSQELLALLEAGLTLTESLDALQEKERRPSVVVVFDSLRSRLGEGQRFASCAGDSARYFSAAILRPDASGRAYRQPR